MVLKGVNLGGWLVLERWITPSVFEGINAEDETSFCLELGKPKTDRLTQHRQTFITKDDFKWMSQNGLNAVRIPVPHWLFGNIKPYDGAVEFLDQAMEWTVKHELKVILDIHTAPGSQNGRIHSGLAGQVNWHKDKNNVSQSLEFLKSLCQRYGHYSNLFGIELLNEPRGWINPRILKKYYQQGYEIVRQNCADNTAVIISDYFAPWRWKKFMIEPNFNNVVRDTHLYQSHRDSDKNLDMDQHIEKVDKEWKKLIINMQKNRPLIIGEWSLALAPQTFAAMNEETKKTALRAYASSQLSIFNTSAGWFYWTYKTEKDNLWSFRHCLETGLLQKI